MSETARPPASVPTRWGSACAPPQARRVPHEVASPFGARTDDYYWLRDDERSDPAVLAHLAAENAYTEQMMAPLAAQERRLFDEMSARLPPHDRSVPVLEHGWWYYARYEAGAEHAVHARRRGSEAGPDWESPEQVLLDGNELARGHEYFELGDYDVSPDGAWLAYTQDTVGRRQYELCLRQVAGGHDLEERVPNVEAEIVWAADNRRVLYIEKDPQTLLSVRVRVHERGQAAAQDRLLYEEADDSYYLALDRSRSERYLFICCMSTEQSEWLYADSADPQLRFRSVLPREAGHEYEVEHLGDDFILRSNWQAPNFRLVRAPVARCADRGAWRDVLAHREDVFLEDFEVASGHLAVNERAGGLLRIRVRAWAAAAPDDHLIESPEPAGTVSLLATPGIESTVLRYAYSSLATPETTYDFDVPTRRARRLKTEAVLGGFDAANYETRHLFVPARDGSRVPVSLALRRGTALDGSAPIYQYGYGAYGYSIDPEFHPSWVSLMDRGFVVAIAHVRGGQELGRAWYDSGRRGGKHNSFTDFIDVTRALVRAGYGAPDRVCAQGGSAGGLLMAAVANLAPQDYRAIVAHVPFVDVATTMLDPEIPLTTNEYDQWGDPRRREDYEYLLSYSPYDNVRAQDYPAMFVFTGLWDSQVQYFEPAKWVARLRERRTDARPLLFQVDLSAGHGGKSGRFERYHEVAREFAFLLHELGLDDAAAPPVAASVNSACGAVDANPPSGASS